MPHKRTSRQPRATASIGFVGWRIPALRWQGASRRYVTRSTPKYDHSTTSTEARAHTHCGMPRSAGGRSLPNRSGPSETPPDPAPIRFAPGLECMRHFPQQPPQPRARPVNGQSHPTAGEPNGERRPTRGSSSPSHPAAGGSERRAPGRSPRDSRSSRCAMGPPTRFTWRRPTLAIDSQLEGVRVTASDRSAGRRQVSETRNARRQTPRVRSFQPAHQPYRVKLNGKA